MADQPDCFTQALIDSVGEDMAFQVLGEFRRGEAVKETLAAVRQARIAAANQRVETVVSESLGQHIMDIDATAYHYWGRRLGYDCWADKQFRREYMRDNPGVRVKTTFRARGKGWTPPAKPAARQGIILTDA